jgi:hypothetical protein
MTTTTTEQTQHTQHTYSLRGPKVLLQGDSGSGKTYSLITLIEAGITPFIIFTEPGMSTLAKALEEHHIPASKCHWKYISTSSQDWSAMVNMSQKINTLSYEGLAKAVDSDRAKYAQWLEVLTTCQNFICDRDGVAYGDVTEWGTGRALIIDSLTGLSEMAMNLVVGAKPTKAMPDWMVAQDNLLRFIHKLTNDLVCTFVLTAHLEREVDEVTGGISLMASTLGRKLAPKLPRNFDEVILTQRIGKEFRWSTAKDNVVLKTRLLSLSDNLPPSFVPLVEAWLKAGGNLPSEETTA